MFNNVDKKLAKLGFEKIKDNPLIVSYERYNSIHKYTQKVNLCHKRTSESIIQSYDKDLFDSKNIGNTCVGLTYKEAKLFLKKMKNKKWDKQK